MPLNLLFKNTLVVSLCLRRACLNMMRALLVLLWSLCALAQAPDDICKNYLTAQGIGARTFVQDGWQMMNDSPRDGVDYINQVAYSSFSEIYGVAVKVDPDYVLFYISTNMPWNGVTPNSGNGFPMDIASNATGFGDLLIDFNYNETDYVSNQGSFYGIRFMPHYLTSNGKIDDTALPYPLAVKNATFISLTQQHDGFANFSLYEDAVFNDTDKYEYYLGDVSYMSWPATETVFMDPVLTPYLSSILSVPFAIPTNVDTYAIGSEMPVYMVSYNNYPLGVEARYPQLSGVHALVLGNHPPFQPSWNTYGFISFAVPRSFFPNGTALLSLTSQSGFDFAFMEFAVNNNECQFEIERACPTNVTLDMDTGNVLIFDDSVHDFENVHIQYYDIFNVLKTEHFFLFGIPGGATFHAPLYYYVDNSDVLLIFTERPFCFPTVLETFTTTTTATTTTPTTTPPTTTKTTTTPTTTSTPHTTTSTFLREFPPNTPCDDSSYGGYNDGVIANWTMIAYSCYLNDSDVFTSNKNVGYVLITQDHATLTIVVEIFATVGNFSLIEYEHGAFLSDFNNTAYYEVSFPEFYPSFENITYGKITFNSTTPLEFCCGSTFFLYLLAQIHVHGNGSNELNDTSCSTNSYFVIFAKGGMCDDIPDVISPLSSRYCSVDTRCYDLTTTETTTTATIATTSTTTTKTTTTPTPTTTATTTTKTTTTPTTTPLTTTAKTTTTTTKVTTTPALSTTSKTTSHPSSSAKPSGLTVAQIDTVISVSVIGGSAMLLTAVFIVFKIIQAQQAVTQTTLQLRPLRDTAAKPLLS